MELNEQEEEYSTAKIKSGLEFYYNFLDKVDPFIFTENNFPLKRSDIIITLNYLKNIPKNHKVNNLAFGHPSLTLAIESIESLEKLNPKNEPEWSKWMVIMSLEYLLNIGFHIIYQKFVFDYQNNQISKTPKESLSKLIEEKASFKNNASSFPSKYLKLVNEFIEVEIEKNKEIINIDSVGISNEASELIISYLNQIKNNHERDDLYSSLKKKEVDNFILKFKRLMYFPSYHDIVKSDRERTFHSFLLGVLKGKLENYHIKSNKESGLGRYDICLNPIDNRDIGVIIEIKKIDDNFDDEKIKLELDSALFQIESKNYLFELHEENVNQNLLVAVVFKGLEPNLKWKLNNNGC